MSVVIFKRRTWLPSILLLCVGLALAAPRQAAAQPAKSETNAKPAKSETNAKPADVAQKDAPALTPIAGYQTQSIDGWTIHVADRLLAEHKTTTEKAVTLLTAHLKEIVRVVPKDALARLRTVPLWMSPEYPNTPPRAEYHPDAGWLRAHDRNPAMAKAIEFTNIRIFEAETKRMPSFVLHELAHAYHDQVLGFEQPDILAAYKRAVESKSYDAVERWNGVTGRLNTIERAYAMTNHKEYFAETTEAFFGRNDFFPFTREELEKHDPEMFKVLEKVWSLPK